MCEYVLCARVCLYKDTWHIYLSGTGCGQWLFLGISLKKSDQTSLFCILWENVWYFVSLAQFVEKKNKKQKNLLSLTPRGRGTFFIWQSACFCFACLFWPHNTTPFSYLTSFYLGWTCLGSPPWPLSLLSQVSKPLENLCQCFESLNCSSRKTRQIRSWGTFGWKTALRFLLMLLPLPLFPNRYINTCIFLFKLSEWSSACALI